jgi:RimJ/RimL family protein N-acetyltransferase
MKLYLRKIIKSDLTLLREWRNSKQFFEFSGQFKLLNMEDQKKWFQQLSKENPDKIMFAIINKNKKIIGTCGLTNIDYKNRSANTAIMIGDATIHGKGYGTESLRMLVEYGFKKMNLHRIEAEIFEFNTVSIKLFEKLNFKYEATLKESLWRHGRWWNTHVYAIFANES